MGQGDHTSEEESCEEIRLAVRAESEAPPHTARLSMTVKQEFFMIKCSYCSCPVAEMVFPIFDGGLICCGSEKCTVRHLLKKGIQPAGQAYNITPGLAQLRFGE